MDARLREGIRLFNAGRFFECHETLEDFYLEAEEEHKPFLEGLVQLAAACRLIRDFGEVKGPVRMIRQAIIRLENYEPTYFGINVKELIQAMTKWTELLDVDADGAPGLHQQNPKIRRRWFFNR